MSVDELPSGLFRARLLIDGVRYSRTLPTEEDAWDWVTITKAKAGAGSISPLVGFSQVRNPRFKTETLSTTS